MHTAVQVAPIVRAPHMTTPGGMLIMRGNEMREGNQSLRFSFRGNGLDKKDMFGKSDPFVRINRVQPDGSRMRVWESTVIKNDLNPVWPADTITMQVRWGNASRSATHRHSHLDARATPSQPFAVPCTLVCAGTVQQHAHDAACGGGV
ncbi:MAG: hypothetical protein EOO65_02180 [Methanosarcinales archaeon]|nr:MAG: hypothetical protein EOO65_02180 [Methanosarcinales archaeon]